MALPIPLSFAPMEAASVEEPPVGSEWQYEPKWDGFRCLIFRDGSKVELQSKASQPLARYFPEIEEAVRKLSARRFVLDGELAIPVGNAFSFDDLLLRLHPAASRVRKLSVATPAIFVAFDLLADEKGRSLVDRHLDERRPQLESFAESYFDPEGRIRLSPATLRLEEAKEWLNRVGATLDGIVAKRRDMPYRSSERDGAQKIKNFRSADCVVGGFRYAAGTKHVGSLLLGLYNDAGELDHVGFCSGIKKAERPDLTRRLEALAGGKGFTGRAPGGPSRWNDGKENPWQPLRPKLVIEVSYDHFTGGRFRHGTRLLRFRPDKSPEKCTFDQIAQKKGNLLQLLAR